MQDKPKTNTKGILLAAIVLAILFVVTGCATNTETDANKQQTKLTGEVPYEPTIVQSEGAQTETATRDYEVYMDADGKLFPKTFDAKTGDNIELVFLLNEPCFISIEEYGVAEEIQKGTILLKNVKKGTATMLCDAQETTSTATINGY